MLPAHGVSDAADVSVELSCVLTENEGGRTPRHPEIWPRGEVYGPGWRILLSVKYFYIFLDYRAGGGQVTDAAVTLNPPRPVGAVRLKDLRKSCGARTPGADIDAVEIIGSRRRRGNSAINFLDPCLAPLSTEHRFRLHFACLDRYRNSVEAWRRRDLHDMERLICCSPLFFAGARNETHCS
jgi:hypothetical protein